MTYFQTLIKRPEPTPRRKTNWDESRLAKVQSWADLLEKLPNNDGTGTVLWLSNNHVLDQRSLNDKVDYYLRARYNVPKKMER